MEIFKRFKSEETGAGMVEYALITALIGLMSFSAITLLGEETSSTFDTVTEGLEQPGQSGGSGGSISMGSGGSGGSGGSDAATTSTTTPATTTSSAPATTTTTMPATTTTTAPATTTTTTPATTTTTVAPSGAPGGDAVGGVDQSAPKPSASKSEFYWWNADKHGGNGAWTASATYQNETNRHQYLDLLVTRVDDKGKTTALEVKSFYVPANGSTTYTLWDNALDIHKDNLKGTVEVRIDVVSVSTSDQNWQPYSYQVASNPTTVSAPTAP